MKKIVLLIDFTGVCLLAMEHVALLARQSLCRVILLHVASPDRESEAKLVQQDVREFALPLENEGVPFAIHVKFGDFFQLISNEITTLNPDLLVVGTHGFKGIKKNFQSSNILNLLRIIDRPALIIQGHASTPMDGYKSVLVPLVGADETVDWIPDLKNFAGVFSSEVRILSFCNTTNKAEVIAKDNEAKKLCEEAGLKCVVELEETSQYTASFYRSIIEYSDIEDSDAIVLILSTGDADYFDITDQENILLNRLGKPILCL